METFLLLHGGGGRRTMAGFADLLAGRTGARVLLPTHPGFGGTERPESLRTVRDLARFYVDGLDAENVTVVGNSFGGWVAAEMALLGGPTIGAAVLVDAVGIEVPGHPVADVGAMTPAELAAHAWHDPSRAPVPPAAGGTGPSPDLQALAAYTGPGMSDPTLLERLRAVDVPVHVIWGASDRVVDVAHAQAFATAIPKARLTVLPASGHLPQLETPEALLSALLDG
ncbi:alpha/beta fold hydrolase [Actinoplanes sp. HUAS TT8]|uniref:alpha/beta fold hydrolase n=1 Tax=Actinoplanes sp. HUAS TT8 TaxID=3447453 RepID=UPI003F51F9A7